MNGKTVKTLARSFFLVPAIMLASCAQDSQQTLSNPYQTKAAGVMSKYATDISTAIGTRLGQRSAVAHSALGGFVGGGDLGLNLQGWNPTGGTPYGGNYLRASLEDGLRTCLTLTHSIPVASENYQFMVATLARCLNTAVQYRNPLYTFGYRNLDPYSQEFWQYGLDSLRPGSYGQYGNYQVYDGYSRNGFITQDLGGP